MATESPLKMMKNVFYFTLKALFVLKIFYVLSCLFGHVGNWFDQKDKVNFKFYDVTTWEINSCNSHISRSKRSETMNFDQLTEYNMRNIFLEKSYTKCGGELFPDPF